MKKILIFIIIIACLSFIIWGLYKRNQSLTLQLNDAQNNVKTTLLQCENLRDDTRILKLTIDQLEYANDSISKKLIEVIHDNKLKSNNIAQLQYILNSSTRTDTITFRDTIFVNNLSLDTTICDKWYNLNLSLRHPSVITVNPSFQDEIITTFSYKKETVNPPKKCFIVRWFQKKHIVTEIKVINNNPYSTIDTTRFIEIVNY